MNLSKAVVALGLAALTVANAQPVTLFFDDFNGPSMTDRWTPALPTATFAGPFLGYTHTAEYKGETAVAYQTLGSDSILRMSSMQAPLERRGWRSSATINSSNFRYEVRFNTLVQSLTTSIDAFLEVWVMDATDSNRYDIVSLFGGDASTVRNFFTGSSIDNNFTSQSFYYQENTYYRYVIEGGADQNIRLSVLDDSGAELIATTLAHDATAFSNGFYVVISQAMGIPTDTSPSDVAIDYAKVTAVPEIVEAVSTNDVTIKLTVTRQGQSSESQNSSKFRLAKFKVTNKDFTGDKTGKIIEAGGKFFIAGTTNQLPLRTSFADFSLESGTANYLSTNITSYSYGSLTFSNDASNCFVVSGQFVEKWTKNKKKNVRFGIMDAAGTGKVASQDVLVQGKITLSGKGADESQPESGVSGVMNQYLSSPAPMSRSNHTK